MKDVQQKILRATHGSPEEKHVLGDLQIQCYVLEDGTAVLSGRGMQDALSLGQSHGTKLRAFLSNKALTPFINNDLAMVINNPIKFVRPGRGGKAASGFEATTLTKICRAILSARRAGILETNQVFQRVAHEAEVIVSAFSDAGIVAYVYEVTGYEKIKDNNVIRSIVARHLEEEVRAWGKEFHDDLFTQLDRIYGNQKTTSRNRPLYYAKFIRKYIYAPLLSGELLKELDKRNPKNQKGHRKHRHHSYTSEDIGLPKVRAQVWQVIGVLKMSASKRKFEENYAKMMGATYQTNLYEEFGELA